MITPVEVLGKELRRGFGYKAVEVDEFLEELAKDYEKVYKENNELREKVSALTENLSHYRTIEESLKRALVLAEETSKETIENANNKAQALEAEASRNAKQLVSEAEDQAEKILTSAKEDFKEEKEQHEKTIENYQKLIRKLESDYQSYKARMKQFINGQMDILDNPVYEMEFEIAGCEQTDGDEEDEQQKQFEMNNKIEICNEGKKAYDIVLRDSFADLLDQMEFLEIEKKKVCIVTESNVAPIYLKEVCELIHPRLPKRSHSVLKQGKNISS